MGGRGGGSGRGGGAGGGSSSNESERIIAGMNETYSQNENAFNEQLNQQQNDNFNRQLNEVMEFNKWDKSREKVKQLNQKAQKYAQIGDFELADKYSEMARKEYYKIPQQYRGE